MCADLWLVPMCRAYHPLTQRQQSARFGLSRFGLSRVAVRTSRVGVRLIFVCLCVLGSASGIFPAGSYGWLSFFLAKCCSVDHRVGHAETACTICVRVRLLDGLEVSPWEIESGMFLLCPRLQCVWEFCFAFCSAFGISIFEIFLKFWWL